MVDLTTLDSEDISPLSRTQDIILSAAPILPSLLSIWGSANIIYMVLRSDKKSVYRRILFGISCSDLLSSLIIPFQTALLPQESSQRAWAIGTDSSCSALGFLQQLASMNVWYYSMLSFYFLLTVKYSVREQDMARRYEPWMHVMSIGYPLVTGKFSSSRVAFNYSLVPSFTDIPSYCSRNWRWPGYLQ